MKLGKWLSDMDSNHDKSLQRALCYRYTIGQRAGKITSLAACANCFFRLCRSFAKLPSSFHSRFPNPAATFLPLSIKLGA